MHFGNLGELPTHIQDFFQINSEAMGSEGLRVDSPHLKASNSSMCPVWNAIRMNQGLAQGLRRLKYDVLCSGKHADTLIQQVVNWCNTVSSDQVPVIPPLDYSYPVVDNESLGASEDETDTVILLLFSL
ncbi:hypothetical protein GYMLUDRAFT_64143 [Collybiopsis luxurians FD-317 M1]|uniref:Uncharacterized protein n=1 Tax=Collybiopsis luxurians FD-317 M1 TaxID=944289 RepID=A0A0D0C468_9AGAR|nr:hypothetical protein GYMLUDRAFT_64143 [Collybiopsis luxurians FD-317 M1]